MKLIDRERVDGTRVTIGHRLLTRNGRPKACRTYTAEYRVDGGKQAVESLGTTNRQVARRRALEIQQRLESGDAPAPQRRLGIDELIERYRSAIQAKGVAPKTAWKYRADLDKLATFCREVDIRYAQRFSDEDLCRFRQWLIDKPYADKTVQGAITVTKQAFKWAWRRKLLPSYPLADVSFPKAKAKPQPCFTTKQVELLLARTDGEEALAFALMAYAGLRIGEVEQLRWEDIQEVVSTSV